jgi:hypothetical protein
MYREQTLNHNQEETICPARQVFLPYLGGLGPYRQKCDEVAANDYEGFALANREETNA